MNGEKIIELLAEMVKGQDRLTGESVSNEEIRLVAEHEKRISKLELAFFK